MTGWFNKMSWIEILSHITRIHSQLSTGRQTQLEALDTHPPEVERPTGLIQQSSIALVRSLKESALSRTSTIH